CFRGAAGARGDPVSRLAAGGRVEPAQMEETRHKLGLDQPLWVQYIAMMRDLLTGGLLSFRTHQPTLQMLLEALPITLVLMAITVGVALVIGIVLGVISALRPNTRIDDVVMVGALFALSVPHF